MPPTHLRQWEEQFSTPSSLTASRVACIRLLQIPCLIWKPEVLAFSDSQYLGGLPPTGASPSKSDQPRLSSVLTVQSGSPSQGCTCNLAPRRDRVLGHILQKSCRHFCVLSISWGLRGLLRWPGQSQGSEMGGDKALFPVGNSATAVDIS